MTAARLRSQRTVIEKMPTVSLEKSRKFCEVDSAFPDLRSLTSRKSRADDGRVGFAIRAYPALVPARRAKDSLQLPHFLVTAKTERARSVETSTKLSLLKVDQVQNPELERSSLRRDIVS